MRDHAPRSLILSLALIAPIACSDGAGGDSESASATTSEATTTAASTTIASESSSTSTTDATTNATTDTTDTTTGGAEPEAAVVVLGTLAGDDLAQSKMDHDAVAMAGEAPAKQAGDIAHDVLLGTALLGTQEGQFLAIDRWSPTDNLDAFYADPNFQAAFGALFAAPPSFATYRHQPEWAQWGDMDVTDGVTPHYYVLARGRLKSADLSAMQTLHDQVALGGKDMALALGDLGHVVFLGRDDPQEFLAVDLWGSSDNIEALYTNPDFLMAFGQLFEGAPTVGVYASTDWHQW